MSSSVSLGRNLVSLKWEEFNIFVVSELAALYQKDDLTDVTLFCEGRSFRAHKVLLSLWSTYFRDVFRGTQHAHPVVILRETNSSDLELILRFIYQGHLLIPTEEADRFLKTAEHFQVAGLKNMRSHVPNFSYSSGNTGGMGGNSASFHEETSGHPTQQSTNIYDVGTSGSSSLFTVSSPQTIHQHQQNHGTPIRSGSANPPSSQPISLGMHTSVTTHPPHPLTSSSPLEPTIHSHPASEPSNQHQVIRQGSLRSVKHGTPPTSTTPSISYLNNPSPSGGFQPATGTVSTSVPSNSNNGGVGVVTRLSSDSVIFQPQPVLIFQNGPPANVPILKTSEPQCIARTVAGESNRPEHTMMVIEGVIGDNQVQIEPSSSTNHGASGTTTCTVYSHPPLTPPPPQVSNSHHHQSSHVDGDEEVLGLPYNAPSPPPPHPPPSHSYSHHPRDVITIADTAPTSQSHHHTHHNPHHIQHISPNDHLVTESNTVVVSHSYAPSTSAYEQAHLQNGSSSNNISSGNSQASSISKTKLNTTEQPTVYAVKRIPPPLPPSCSSPPPHASRNIKSAPLTKNNNSSCAKGKSLPGHHSNTVSPVPTSSKSSGTSGDIKIVGSSRNLHHINPSNIKTDSASNKNYPQTSCSSTTSSRKVVLVPCPKCGKKVKQTSLKVHMKRTHLEEGTVLVCPICSKRISSKGVYYKHMYIHRKRSEVSSKATTTATTAVIKTESQGT